MRRVVVLEGVLLVALLVVGLAAAGPGPPPASPYLPGFALTLRGPDGGTAWQGVIPNGFVAGADRPSIVYLPPGYSTAGRYPVFYVLHGLPGSPYSILFGLRFADVADRLIASGRIRPFVAAMPIAGVRKGYDGEWAGRWEEYVVRGVVPWVDRHLATLRDARDRAIAGLSAGGFGAVDIALRHPGLFDTVESWSGYFQAPHDGPLRHAPPRVLAAHDPTLLAAGQAAALRRVGVRFFLSCGSTHDRWTAARTRTFARELAVLRIPRRLWLAPGGHDGRFWRKQLPAALENAFAPGLAVSEADIHRT